MSFNFRSLLTPLREGLLFVFFFFLGCFGRLSLGRDKGVLSYLWLRPARRNRPCCCSAAVSKRRKPNEQSQQNMYRGFNNSSFSPTKIGLGSLRNASPPRVHVGTSMRQREEGKPQSASERIKAKLAGKKEGSPTVSLSVCLPPFFNPLPGTA